MENDPLLNRVRNWFGLGSDAETAVDNTHRDAEPPSGESTAAAANRERLGEIFSFLMEHRLPVDAETLAFAHDVATGVDPRLAGIVNRRLRDSEPLTRDWIEQVRADTGGDDARNLAKLRERLEKSIQDFTKTTSDARLATTDYRTALRSHVDELDGGNNVGGDKTGGDKAGAMIIELANVAKAMLERTAVIENQMVRTERETKLLQKRLDEARRAAELDHLTGLPNRRAFEALLASEFEESRRTHDALCVAFCDIDKFKSINDEHGHDAGDRVLKVVARTLAEISDDRCHVARHGGEEFVVLFRGKAIQAAFEQLDGARESMAGRRLVNRATDKPFGQVSFSAGLADVFAFRDPRAALKAADEALYAAKEQGRNRVVIAVAKPEARAA